jgi:dTDP-4-dehydrorhamnose reductase
MICRRIYVSWWRKNLKDKMNAVAVLGSTGYLGSHFVRSIEDKGWRVFGLSRKQIDYTNTDLLSAWVRKNKPDFLINAAGYTGKPNVDACEHHKAECLMGNAVLPGRIREACEELGVPWGHVSSGCTYSGRRPDGGGWLETDPPNFSFRSPPCSFYSGTKALGEEVLDGASDCYVWRLRIPFNHENTPRNYLSKVLNYDRLLEAENSVSHLDEFVEACLDCFEKAVDYGIYNITNPGSITTRQVTEWMLEEGVTTKKFDFFEDEESFMREAASTPRSNCVLDSSKLASAGIFLRPVEDAIRSSLQIF